MTSFKNDLFFFSWNRAISKLSLDNIHDPEERKVAESLIHYDFDAEVEWLK